MNGLVTACSKDKIFFLLQEDFIDVLLSSPMCKLHFLDCWLNFGVGWWGMVVFSAQFCYPAVPSSPSALLVMQPGSSTLAVRGAVTDAVVWHQFTLARDVAWCLSLGSMDLAGSMSVWVPTEK